MWIYLVNILAVVLATHLARGSKSSLESRLFLSIAFVSMVLVAGLRDRTVGTDTGAYVAFFDATEKFSDAVQFGSATWEYGFWILNWLVRLASDEYLLLFIAIALIVIGCYQRVIVAYSVDIRISMFVFTTMGFYTFFFNGARQGIACAICALAIGSLLQRNFKRYCGWILLATLFHKTAVIMLPVYFLFDKTNTFKKNIIYAVIGATCFFLLQTIVEIGAQIDERYRNYGSAAQEAGAGYLMVAFNCALTLFFLAFKRKVRIERERYGLFLNMLVFGAAISLVSAFAKLDPSGLLRLTLYFNVSVIFLWPIVFKNLRNPSVKLIFGHIFIAGYLVFFVLTTERFSNLTPYMLNPSLFLTHPAF